VVSIGSEDQWQNYVRSVMRTQYQCLDLFMQKVSIGPTPHGSSSSHGHSVPHGYSREEGNPAPVNLASFDPLLPNNEVDVEDVVAPGSSK
jgi:hypothetical protein